MPGLRRTLSYPVRGNHGETVVVAGIALSFLLAGLLRVGGPLGIIVGFPLWLVLLGYVVRVLTASADGRTDPPGVGGLRGLVADGLRASVLLALYAIGPLVAMVGGEAALVPLVDGGTPGIAGYLAVLISMLILVVVLPAAFLLPAALTRTGRTGSLRAGLPSRGLVSATRRVDYFVGWSVGVVGIAVVYALATALAAGAGELGSAIAVPLSFYGVVVAAHVVGRSFGLGS